MIFEKTILPGVLLAKSEKAADQRGYFLRTFCQKEFAEQGVHFNFAQSSISFNHAKGTFRGMHFQTAPYGEEKLVSCTRGAIRDYVADIRPESPTYKQWFSIDLFADDRWTLYLPKGIAHGFYSLEDNTEVSYFISEFYQPDHAKGIRWDDPAFNFKLPSPPVVISARDQAFPSFDVAVAEGMLI